MPRFPFMGPLEKSLHARSTMNAVNPDGSRPYLLDRIGPVDRIGPGDDQEVVGHVGERDPRFLAVEHKEIAPLDAGRLDGASIAARARLGQAVAGHLPALRLRHEIPLFLILGPPREKRQTVEARVDRHDDAKRRVHVLEFFARQAEANVVHADAAVFLRHGNPQQSQRRHPSENAPAVETVLPIDLLSVGPNLAHPPMPH